MDLNIENKVALVAASSRGLGKAIALQLSKEGAKELAYTVAFLASEGAAYITGTAIQVDGGFIKGLY